MKSETPQEATPRQTCGACEVLSGRVDGHAIPYGVRFCAEHNSKLNTYDSAAAQIAELTKKLTVAEALADSLGHPVESPCGHSGAYAYSDDGGKNIRCLLCSEATLTESVVKAQSIAIQRGNDLIELRAEIATLKAENEKLKGALRELLAFGVEFDDARLSYVVAHMDRDAIAAARAALEITV